MGRQRLRTVAWVVLAAALIGASWLVNLREYRAAGLPAPGFLDHRIESGGQPGESFSLFYIANNDDKRVPVAFASDELSDLRFEEVHLYGDYGRLRLYRALASFQPAQGDAGAAEKGAEPQVITSMNVYYERGGQASLPIGKLIINPGAPASADTSATAETGAAHHQQLATFTGGGTSSTSSGFGSFTIDQPATLRSLTSAYMSELGDAFSAEVRVNGELADLPAVLNKGDQVKVSYQFNVPERSSFAMMPLSLRLAVELIDAKGETELRPIWAARAPYPTAAALRQFVSEQRSAVQ